MQSILIALLLTTLVHSVLLGVAALVAARWIPDPARRGWVLRAAIVAPLATASLQVAMNDWIGWRLWRVFVESVKERVEPVGAPVQLDARPTPPPPAERSLAPREDAPTIARPDEPKKGAAWGDWLLGLWMAGALVGVVDLAHRRRRFVVGLRRAPLRDADARERLRALTSGSTPRLTASPVLSVPIAISSREICVPRERWSELSGREKDALLAHELAHVERRDPAWFHLEQVVERLLFVQPLVRILRRESRRAAELACDERAARATSRPVELARCLATVASWAGRGTTPVSIASMARSDAPIVDRVERLLELDRQPAPKRRQAAFGAALVASLVAFACAAPNFAVPSHEDETSHAVARPLQSDTLLVEVEKTGQARLSTGGGDEPLGTFDLDDGLDAFHDALSTAAARFPRGGPGPMSDKLADGLVRIRTSPDTAFYYVQLVMQECGKQDVMVWNLELETAGRQDAVFPYQLPTDVGVGIGPVHPRLGVRATHSDTDGVLVRLNGARGLFEEEVEEGEVEVEAPDEREQLEDRIQTYLANQRELTIEDLESVLEDPERPFAVDRVTLQIHDGVTGAEAARLIDVIVDAGATDIVFTGMFR